MGSKRSRLGKFLLLLFLVANPSTVCSIGLDPFISDISDNPFDDGTTQKYYDGNRPQPSPDTSEDLPYISGITLYELEEISKVDFCNNPLQSGASSHTCKDSCGKYSGHTSYLDCSCDTLCYNYNDCCPDYEIACINGWQPNTKVSPDITASTTEASLTENTTAFKLSTTQTPLYVIEHNHFYDDLDFLRRYIPVNIKRRPVNTNLVEECHTSTITPDFSYYMVADCPDHSLQTDIHRCFNSTVTSTDSIVPVYSKSDGLFYANKFCAACHGHKNQSQLDSLTLSCEWICDKSESPYIEDAPRTVEQCRKSSCFSLKWVFAPNPPRLCNPEVIATCPLDDIQAARACQFYSAYTFGNNGTDIKLYKNVHCAYCHGVNETRNQCSGTDSDDNVSGLDDGKQVPLTVLFDFTGGTLQKSETYGGPPPPLVCPEYHIYDRIWHVCRRVSCPPGAVQIDKECAFDTDLSGIKDRMLSDSLDPSYRKIVVEMASEQRVNLTDAKIMELVYGFWFYYANIDYYTIEHFDRADNVDAEIEMDWDGQMWTKSRYIADEEDCLKNCSYGLSLSLEGKVQSGSVESGITRVGNWLHMKPSCNPNLKHGLLVTRVTYSNFPDADNLCNSSLHIPKPFGDESFTKILVRNNPGDDDLYQIQMRFNNKPETFNSSEVAQEVVFTGGKMYVNEYGDKVGNWTSTNRVYFCEAVPLCPLITLRKDEYQWQFDKDDVVSLILMKTGRKVPNEKILLTQDKQVQICVSSYGTNEYSIFVAFSPGQSLATTIGCAVSLTLLALVIITYFSFPGLRNVPGKTVLNLSMSLFLAQLLFLTGAGQTANSIVCLIIACVLHFTWLSVFAWTNILAFDLAQTFGKKSSMRGDKGSGKRFAKYVIYAFGIPFIIVAITTALHFWQEIDGETEHIYAVTHSCWLRGGPTVLIAFGAPVAIALLINVTCFARTVHGIRSTMKAAKILKKDQKEVDNLAFLKKELSLYIRLSVSVGLTWISGFIIPYTGVEELGYLFIILNSLQGPVIFFSFICSRRVMKLWTNKLGVSLYIGSSFSDRSRNSTLGSKTMQTQTARSEVYENNNV